MGWFESEAKGAAHQLAKEHRRENRRLWGIFGNAADPKQTQDFVKGELQGLQQKAKELNAGLTSSLLQQYVDEDAAKQGLQDRLDALTDYGIIDKSDSRRIGREIKKLQLPTGDGSGNPVIDADGNPVINKKAKLTIPSEKMKQVTHFESLSSAKLGRIAEKSQSSGFVKQGLLFGVGALVIGDQLAFDGGALNTIGQGINGLLGTVNPSFQMPALNSIGSSINNNGLVQGAICHFEGAAGKVYDSAAAGLNNFMSLDHAKVGLAAGSVAAGIAALKMSSGRFGNFGAFGIAAALSGGLYAAAQGSQTNVDFEQGPYKGAATIANNASAGLYPGINKLFGITPP